MYLTRQIDVQPCFNNDFLASLADIAAQSLSDLENIVDTYSDDEMIDSANDEAEAQIERWIISKDAVEARKCIQKYSLKIKDDQSILHRLLFRNIGCTSIDCINVLIDFGVDFNYTDDINLRNPLHGYIHSI